MTPTAAFALGGPAPGAVTAQTVKLPSGPGSVRGLADNATVSSFTGQVQYAVPIVLPKGLGGLTPSLSLAYAGELGNGPLGVGWALSQAGVRRSLRLGVPAYDSTDELELVGLGAGGELVRLADGTYRVEGQGHSYLGREVNGGFELIDADGMIYRLGVTATGRTASGTRTAFWHLQEVVDARGHSIEYRYRQLDGEVYLDQIAWGPNVGGERAFRAELVYGSRSDTVVSYRTGFRVATTERLEKIRVWSFGAVQRIVTLSYDDRFALTRLSGVRVTGADGVALPALTFQYATTGTGVVQAVPGADGWALNLSGTSLFDVDDDGAMDLLRLTANGHSYRRNLGGQFDVARPVPGADGATLDKVRLLDLTGDSSAEIVWQQGSQWKVFQLAGADAASRSWSAQGNLGGAGAVNLAAAAVADLDGDYRMDFLSVSGSRIEVRMGGATGLGAPVRFGAIDPTRTFIQPGNAATSFPDVNGDGLADAVYTAASSLYLYLGKGDGQFEKYRDVPYPWSGPIDPSQLRLGDLNRDGLLDLAVVKAGNVAWYRGQANGTLSATAIEVARPPGTDASVVVAVADANGNGSEDIVWSSAAGLWIVDLAGPTSAGMLVAIDNGLGQTQSFTYAASAQLAFAAAAAGEPWTTNIPVSVPVTVGNRLALASGEPARSTRLDVRDGVYDRGERRFLGFANATVTRPDPADGVPPSQMIRRIQRYHPGLGADRALRGQLVSERIVDGAGHVYRDTRHDVAAFVVAGLPVDDPRLRRAIVRSTETRHHEGHATPLISRVEYAHDSEGRMIEERMLGRLDLTGDESIVRHRFTGGRSAQGARDRVCETWLVGLDAGGGERVLSHTQTLFGDHQSTAPLCDAGSGRERVTRAELLGASARWIDLSRIDYDARGNPIRFEKDGVIRELEYDVHGLHSVAEVIRPSATKALRWEATWDYVQGQPVTVRDATGVAMDATYDSLGRLTSVARGGAAPHLHYRYHWSGPRPYQETFTYDGDAGAVVALPATWSPGSRWRRTVDVANSAGEPLLSATQLATDRWIVAGYRTRDALGRSVSIADSFEWRGTADAIAGVQVPASVPVRTVSYDGLDRVIGKTLPTGATDTYSYRAFETTVTTSGLAPVTTYLDGAARIRRTTRSIAGTIEAVDARYDAAGRLTSIQLAGATATSPVEHRFEYDSLGRLVFATDPDIGARHLAYDDAGRVTALTNGAGQTIQYTYDGAGRLASKRVDAANAFVFHYDDALDGAKFRNTAGRLAWVEEPTGRVELGYDELGRQNQVRRTVAGYTANAKTAYAASGLVLSVDHEDGLVVDYAYDPAGRTIRIGDLWQVEAQDATGRVLHERFGNGIVQTYQRDVLGQATRIRVARATGAPLHDASVSYNEYGAITSVTDHDGVGLDHTASFAYDGGARLVEALLGQGAAQFQFRYQYDGLQNMIRREARGPQPLGIVTGHYRYGETTASGPRGPRQLTSSLPDVAAGSAPGAAPIAFDYDAAGRMIAQGTLALDYNAFDQLIRVRGIPGASGAATVEHAYGYDGARVLTRNPDGTQRIWFSQGLSQVEDGARELDVRLDGRLLARITRAPATAAAESSREPASIAAIVYFTLLGAGCVFLLVAIAMPRRAHRGRAALAAALLVAIIHGGCGPAPVATTSASMTTRQTLYYHRLVGAGPSIITRADGTVFEERRYEPFGAAIDAYRELETGGVELGTVDHERDPHDILNQQTDPATGWSDHGARWMAPDTGRWLTPDPPVKAPDPSFMSRPWAMHPYQHVQQNPLLYWDPDGRDIVPKWLERGWNATTEFVGDEVIPRAVGAAKVGVGLGGMVVGGALCKTGVGCLAGGPLIVLSADVGGSGIAQVIHGSPQPTVVGTLLGPEAQQVEEAIVGGAALAGPVAALRPVPFAPAAPMCRSVPTPTIVAGTNKEMLGQALSHLKGMRGTPADKAAAFEDMAGQIHALSGGSWTAVRSVGADGSHIFMGTYGQSLVISPTNQLYMGSVATAGHFGLGQGGVLQPIYKALKLVE